MTDTVTITLTHAQACDLLNWVELAADHDEMSLDEIEQKLIDVVYEKESQ